MKKVIIFKVNLSNFFVQTNLNYLVFINGRNSYHIRTFYKPKESPTEYRF